ncbi:hypothetical protein DSCA_24530 [Desulfosarcina alkanivorans]|uniref:Phospholipase C/D domain-containing protein n=1 Tax=Desulfosarcina alkanivorans TaxID=571177 RepID=A0A5K7YJ27_9BACT|nr:hypothetical protein [Desulfosarcina alkanivorans]BBO68523.1 hypothetical protein DSCA_24530 [Desulfosarcina alkanivorans]
MALPATHIRFALSVANGLPAEQMGAYLSGTLYPDSRWLTGVHRRKTHARRFLDPAFPSDAFTLGWHVHCVCDRIQRTLFDRLLGGPAQLDADARWIRASAAKVIQDMQDAAAAELDERLPLLVHAQTPNSESKDRVTAYLDLVRRAYRGQTRPAWPVYARLWGDVGLDRLKITAIEKQVLQFLADRPMATRIKTAFGRMAAAWESGWQAPGDEGTSGGNA